jgi:hypothetical protein
LITAKKRRCLNRMLPFEQWAIAVEG